MEAKSKHHGSVQGKPRFRTIPSNELLHRELVVSPGMLGIQVVEHCRLRVVEIRQTEDNLPANGLLVLLVHTSSLHAACMDRRYTPPIRYPQSEASKSAQVIWHELKFSRLIEFSFASI